MSIPYGYAEEEVSIIINTTKGLVVRSYRGPPVRAWPDYVMITYRAQSLGMLSILIRHNSLAKGRVWEASRPHGMVTPSSAHAY